MVVEEKVATRESVSIQIEIDYKRRRKEKVAIKNYEIEEKWFKNDKEMTG